MEFIKSILLMCVVQLEITKISSSGFTCPECYTSYPLICIRKLTCKKKTFNGNKVKEAMTLN